MTTIIGICTPEGVVMAARTKFEEIKKTLGKIFDYVEANGIYGFNRGSDFRNFRTYRGLEISTCNHEYKYHLENYGITDRQANILRDWIQEGGLGCLTRYPNLEEVYSEFGEKLSGEYDFFVEEVNNARKEYNNKIINNNIESEEKCIPMFKPKNIIIFETIK